MHAHPNSAFWQTKFIQSLQNGLSSSEIKYLGVKPKEVWTLGRPLRKELPMQTLHAPKIMNPPNPSPNPQTRSHTQSTTIPHNSLSIVSPNHAPGQRARRQKSWHGISMPPHNPSAIPAFIIPTPFSQKPTRPHSRSRKKSPQRSKTLTYTLPSR